MVIIEGIEVRAKTIPKRQLISKWQKLTCKPFPKIRAYQLKDYDFNRVIRLKRCEEDMQRELKEWNTILTTEGTDACVFNTEEKSDIDFMILIRENPYHALDRIIEHELSHIIRGDL